MAARPRKSLAAARLELVPTLPNASSESCSALQTTVPEFVCPRVLPRGYACRDESKSADRRARSIVLLVVRTLAVCPCAHCTVVAQILVGNQILVGVAGNRNTTFGKARGNVLTRLVIDASATLLRTALGDSSRGFLMVFHPCCNHWGDHGEQDGFPPQPDFGPCLKAGKAVK